MNSRVGDHDDDGFSALLAACELRERDDEQARGRVALQLPASWGQGRSTFGGLLAGLALEGMAALVPEQGPPRRARSLQVGFVGPVAGAVELELERLRHGRSATSVRAQIVAEGTVRMTALACFAADRASAVELPAPSRPSLAGPEGALALPYIEGVTPAFTRHFELRWATGGPPGSRIDSGEFHGWIRARERVVGPGPAWIAALVDAWPAPALQTLARPGPASSLSWAIDFVAVDPEARSDAWWAFAVETERASGGWAHTRARLWSPAGILVASSTQTVAVFA